MFKDLCVALCMTGMFYGIPVLATTGGDFWGGGTNNSAGPFGPSPQAREAISSRIHAVKFEKLLCSQSTIPWRSLAVASTVASTNCEGRS
jgi:hypothetical protein